MINTMSLSETMKKQEYEDRDIMAVDAVIIPPVEITGLAVSLSEQLRNTSPITLNTLDYLPHVTLAMGYLTDLEKAKRVMRKAISELAPLTITLESIFRSPKDFQGYYFYHLTARGDEFLQKLHEYLVDNLPFAEIQKPTTRFFLPESNGEIVDAVFDYVGAFRTRHSKGNFWPHITLGAGPEGRLQTDQLPLQFTITNISLCQLGNFCTCRKILMTV